MPRLHPMLFVYRILAQSSRQPQLRMSLFTPSSPSSMSAPTLKDSKEHLYSAHVKFDPTDGKENRKFELDAVYQDTFPSGSPLGTVVTMHGSPGSHADFKYITPLLVEKGIRVIGINFPGFGHSQDHVDLNHDNDERNAFVQAIIDGLSLNERIIFLGHSRGADNAIKMSARNVDRTIGTVLVAPLGLRVNKGIRPYALLTVVRWLYNNVTFLRGFIEFLLYKHYNANVGLKMPTGRMAINSVKSMHQTSLGRQAPFMKRIIEHPHIRLLFMYTCKDFLVEKEISREFVETIKDRKHFTIQTKDEKEEEELTEAVKKAYFSENQSAVTVEFAVGSHFLQKERAKFIAESIEAICKASNGKEINQKL